MTRSYCYEIIVTFFFIMLKVSLSLSLSVFLIRLFNLKLINDDTGCCFSVVLCTHMHTSVWVYLYIKRIYLMHIVWVDSHVLLFLFFFIFNNFSICFLCWLVVFFCFLLRFKNIIMLLFLKHLANAYFVNFVSVVQQKSIFWLTIGNSVAKFLQHLQSSARHVGDC